MLGPHGYLELPEGTITEGSQVEALVKKALAKLARSGMANCLHDIDAGIKYELHLGGDGKVYVYFETQPRD